MHPTKNPIVHSKHFNVIISEHFSSQSRNLSDRFLFVKSEYKLKWNFREKIRSISQKNRSPLHFWNIFVHSKKERLMNDKNPPLARSSLFIQATEHFSRRRWTTIKAPVVSYSVHEGNNFLFQLWVDFFKLIYHGAGTVVHLLLL